MAFLAALSPEPSSAEQSRSRDAYKKRGFCLLAVPAVGVGRWQHPALRRVLFLAGRFLGPLDSTPQSRLTDRQDSSPVR